MSGLDLPLQIKGEVLRKVLEFGEISAHFAAQKLKLGLEIVLDAEGKQTGRTKHHDAGFPMGEPKATEVFKLGDEGVLDARDEEDGGAAGDAVATDEAETAEEVECGEEPVGNA